MDTAAALFAPRQELVEKPIATVLVHLQEQLTGNQEATQHKKYVYAKKASL